ncbi:hypothetical protein Ahy_A02g004932 [Arachis hypogaea]|uniref:Uncharacterized protein n=1 Tax=Arachis hypogaea TaxID=3818 RepID=A0A445E559_ARAHY|nr:hypothetical protein Ahy_A02g004932 [Arachis hypogaea]
MKEKCAYILSAKVKSVKENVAALEMEMKKLKAMVAVVEVDLEMARNELVKVEEGFLVIDSCAIIAEVCVENDDHQHLPNDNHIMPLITRNSNNK